MDFILIGLTLVLGVLGTLWKDPPKLAKVVLIVLLIASTGASAWKSVTDERDKELLQTLAVAGLALPNSAYDKVYQQLNEAFGDGADAKCHHTTEGMTCVEDTIANQPARTVVFNRYEVAQIYADAVRGKDTKSFLMSILHKNYDPKHLSDDYEDKLGILGYDIFYDMCARFPNDYNYDDKFGVKLLYQDDNGQHKTIEISSKEMTEPMPDFGPMLFRHFEQMYRERILAALPDCTKALPRHEPP